MIHQCHRGFRFSGANLLAGRLPFMDLDPLIMIFHDLRKSFSFAIKHRFVVLTSPKIPVSSFKKAYQLPILNLIMVPPNSDRYFCKSCDYGKKGSLYQGWLKSKKKNVGNHVLFRDKWATTAFKKLFNTENIWHFSSKFMLNYLWKVHDYCLFSFSFIIAFAKICFFHRVVNHPKYPKYLEPDLRCTEPLRSNASVNSSCAHAPPGLTPGH